MKKNTARREGREGWSGKTSEWGLNEVREQQDLGMLGEEQRGQEQWPSVAGWVQKTARSPGGAE